MIIIIEKIFNIPGLGSEFVGAITSRDYPMIMGTTIFLAVFVIIMNVIVDLLYAVVDPRIKLKQKREKYGRKEKKSFELTD